MTKVDHLATDVFSYTTHAPPRVHNIAAQSESVDGVAKMAGWSCGGSGYLGHLADHTGPISFTIWFSKCQHTSYAYRPDMATGCKKENWVKSCG